MLCTSIVLNVNTKNKIIHVHNVFWACSFHALNLYFSCTELLIQWTIFCGLVDARIRASEKDLPVSTKRAAYAHSITTFPPPPGFSHPPTALHTTTVWTSLGIWTIDIWSTYLSTICGFMYSSEQFLPLLCGYLKRNSKSLCNLS